MIKVYKGRHSFNVKLGRILVKIFKGREYYYNWKKEVIILKKLGKYDFIPKIYFYIPLIIVREFINGIYFKDYLKKEKNRKRLNKVLLKLLNILKILDKEKIKKEELNRPTKNIIIGKNFRIYLIDFERSKFRINPRNIYEFLGFIISKSKNREKLINLVKKGMYEKVIEEFTKF